MFLADYGPIAIAIRQAIVNEAPWLLWAPGRASWSLLIAPAANSGIINLPHILAYLALREHPSLQPGAVIDYQRLASVLALELPIIGEPGLRLKVITLRDGLLERKFPSCCQVRTSDLAWAQVPQIEEQTSSVDIDACFFVPPPGCATQWTQRFAPGWSGPDLGAASCASASIFYSLLDPLDLADRSPTMHRPLVMAYLIRHREAERVRCQLLGHALPAWLLDDLDVDAEIEAVLRQWLVV